MLVDPMDLSANKQFISSKSPSTVRAMLHEKRKKSSSNTTYTNCDNNINNSYGCTRLVTNDKLDKNTTELFDAILNNDFNEARRLISEERLDVNSLNIEGNTPLHVAAATGYLDCLELLLAYGARINARDTCQHTPLEYAVVYGNFDCALLLIENGADTTSVKDGFSHLW